MVNWKYENMNIQIYIHYDIIKCRGSVKISVLRGNKEKKGGVDGLNPHQNKVKAFHWPFSQVIK